jgi:hypothetical protein
VEQGDSVHNPARLGGCGFRGLYAGFWIHSLWQNSPDVPSPRIASIAVLLFGNSGNQTKFEYFSDDLTDELIDALAKMEDIREIGWEARRRDFTSS